MAHGKKRKASEATPSPDCPLKAQQQAAKERPREVRILTELVTEELTSE